jgi:hypothetical protein
VRHFEEPAQQRGASSDLVGLAAAAEKAADRRPLVDQRLPENRPRRRGVAVAARGRVMRGQPRQGVVKDEPMHRAHEPKRKSRTAGLLFETLEDSPCGSLQLEVVRRGLEQRGVERGV